MGSLYIHKCGYRIRDIIKENMYHDRHPNLSKYDISTWEYRPIDRFYPNRMSVSPSSVRRFMKRAVNVDMAVNVEACSEMPVG